MIPSMSTPSNQSVNSSDTVFNHILLVTCIDIYNNDLLYVLAVSQSLVYIYTKYNFISASTMLWEESIVTV